LEQTYNAVCNYIGWIQLGNVATEDIIDLEKRTLRVNKTLTKAKERDYNGGVMGKIKKTFSDITKTESGNRVIPLNDMAVSLLKQIQDYNSRKKIKTDYIASTAEGG
jgi:hypothetical protein